MNLAPILRLGLGWMLALPAGGPAAAPAGPVAPRAVATQPRPDDTQVDPESREVVVVFDQDMDPTGYSFTGGGTAFPKVTGPARWRTARECALPVQLEPGRAYRVGINSATHRGFQSAAGVPAAPLVLEFRTRDVAAGPPGAEPAGARHAESVRQLRQALAEGYAYREVRALDWADAWRRFEPRLLAAGSAREFAVVAGQMLAGTRDPHIWLLEGGEIVPAFRRDVRPNVNHRLLPGLIDGWTQPHPMLAVGRAAADVGYLAVHSWEKRHGPRMRDAALAALRELRDLPALILDVRLNSGGDETLAREFAGGFVRDRVRYARHASIDPAAPGGFAAPVDRWLEPNPGSPPYLGRVAVLMGRVNMSTAESFLLMMKQTPGTRLIGERSYGASGNPRPHVLANSVTVLLPSWQAFLPDGTLLETNGVAPDVDVPWPDDGLSQTDPVLARAIALLTRGRP